MSKSMTQQFRDWVAQQDPAATYYYANPCGCALHQFLTEAGYPVAFVDPFDWVERDGSKHSLPLGLDTAVCRKPWTFGALSSRLEGVS